MSQIIINLKKDLIDHQDVEKELAKRSYYCQKVIQKFKEQLKELKNDISSTDA